jgi:phage-related protein
MGRQTIGAGIKLDGETEFKKAISGINSDMRVLGSEMKKVTSEFIDNKDSLEALTAKDKVLNDQLDKQKEKIDAVKKALENSKTQYGENDEKTKRWQITLNDAESQLNKLNTEIKQNKTAMENVGTETAQTTDKVEKFTRETNQAADKTDKFGDKLKSASSHLGSGFAASLKVGMVGVAALGAALVATAAGLGKVVTASLENADAVQKTADIYGMSAERVQELTYVGTKLDVELETMTKAQTKVTKSMYEASQGSKGATAAFKALGVSVVDSKGNLRDSQTVMAESITKLGAMKNETERDALAMKIFGKSAMELNPLIKAGGAEFAKLAEEARKTGAVLSNEAIKGLDDFGDSLAGLKQSLKGIGGTFAASLLPAMDGALKFSQGLIPILQESLKTGDFTALGKELGNGLTKAMSSIAIGIDKLMPVVINLLTSLTEGIVKAIPVILPALIDGVLALLDAFILIVKDNGPLLIKAGMDAILSLVNGMLEMLPDIVKLGLDMIVQLALGIADALPELIPTIVSTVLTIVDTLIANIDKLIDASIAIMMALADGIIAALPLLLDKLPEIIDKLVVALVDNLPKLIEMGIKFQIALAKALIKAIPQLLKAIPEIIGSLVTGFGNMGEKMLDVGKNLVSGIWDGILRAKDWLLEKIKGFGGDVMTGIKDFFGIKSPSALMRDQVGKNLALGLGEGFSAEMKGVSDSMNKKIPKSFEMDMVVNSRNNAMFSQSSDGFSSGTGTSDIGSIAELIKNAVGDITIVVQAGTIEMGRAVVSANTRLNLRTGGAQL